MANYKYRAVDQQGGTQKGVLAAENVDDLRGRLKEGGKLLIEAKETREVATGSHGTVKVKPQVILEFVTHMSSLSQAGVPVLTSLINLAQEASTPQFGLVLDRVWRTVETGVPLHTAMSQYPRVFPQLVVNLVQAGEESGTLPETFVELQRYLEWVERMKGEVRQAVIYPTTILTAVLALFILMFTFVIPRFTPILESLNVPLPFVTVVVLAFSKFMENTWWVWAILLIGIPVGIIASKSRVPGFALLWDTWMLKIPVFGPLKSMVALSRFTHNFGVLYKAGIPVLQGLSLCQRLVGNLVIAKALKKVEQDVSEGATISNALRLHPVFPSILIQMVSVGEAAGRLDQTMLHVAHYYNEEIPRRVKKIFGIMEPMITVGLIGTVGIVAVSIFLPMMSLMGGMR
ncbi:MAG: type II secretion system F family protein [Nitrospirales bacterium]|nr:type II secretion system F family protein [Nitrospira sp.]MDR4500543.1 type II secretion system F family protein [Nitrospirales bacterium]